MREQTRWVKLLVVLMCLARGGLAVVGYLWPGWLAAHLGAPIAANPQLPYLVRVWAARDLVIAVATLASPPRSDS